MAKRRKAARSAASSKTCLGQPTWIAILTVLVGLWFALADLNVFGTGGLTLWPLVILIYGLYLWANAGPMKPAWFGLVVTIIGLLFVLQDLGTLSLGGLTLWPLVILLVGLAGWMKFKC